MADKLDILHSLLTDEMIRQLRDREEGEDIPAAVLSAISKFLKDNHFEADTSDPDSAKLEELLKEAEENLPDGVPL